MDATSWTVVEMGVTILIAMGASFQKLRDRIDAQGKETNERIDAQGKETSEQMAQLRERMAKLEGLLEGLREAITGKRAAWRGHTETNHPAAG